MSKLPTADDFLQDHPQISHYYDDITDEMVCFSKDVQKAMIEFAKLQSVAFAKWIANSELLYTKQLYEAMIVYKCETVEELFDYFIKNHYNK
jgi:hypothetical protein